MTLRELEGTVRTSVQLVAGPGPAAAYAIERIMEASREYASTHGQTLVVPPRGRELLAGIRGDLVAARPRRNEG